MTWSWPGLSLNPLPTLTAEHVARSCRLLAHGIAAWADAEYGLRVGLTVFVHPTGADESVWNPHWHVQQFFNEVAGDWRPKFRAKEIDFISGVSSDMMPRIAVDADRLAEILDALLSNALKFTQDGHVLCTISPSGEAGVAIRISDTGIGMDPSDIQRVFEPFARTKAAVTTGIEGAGLGLTKALAIAKRMGGDLTLSRSSEGGIVALVTLEDVRSSRAKGIGPTWQRRKSRHR